MRFSFSIGLSGSALVLLRFARGRRRHLGTGRSSRRGFAFGWLGRVRTKELAFKGCAIEPADNGLHFFLCWCIDERESFGFLRLMIANDFDRVGHEVFCGQPSLDVVGGHPHR